MSVSSVMMCIFGVPVGSWSTLQCPPFSNTFGNTKCLLSAKWVKIILAEARKITFWWISNNS